MRRRYVFGALAVGTVLSVSAILYADQAGMFPPGPSGFPPVTREPEATKPELEKGVTKSADASACHLCQVSDLIGMEVLNHNQEKLGKIENLAIDPIHGNVRYAVVAFGETLGFGGKLLPMPWSALKLVSTTKTGEEAAKVSHFLLRADSETLAKAPSVEKGEWPNFGDRKLTTAIEQFYRPYLAEREEGTITR